jgi:hypothetical protein
MLACRRNRVVYDRDLWQKISDKERQKLVRAAFVTLESDRAAHAHAHTRAYGAERGIGHAQGMGWNQSWEDMTSKLPQDDCRFVVYMWERDPKRFIPLFIIWYEPLLFFFIIIIFFFFFFFRRRCRRSWCLVAHKAGCDPPPTTGRPMAVASRPR